MENGAEPCGSEIIKQIQFLSVAFLRNTANNGLDTLLHKNVAYLFLRRPALDFVAANQTACLTCVHNHLCHPRARVRARHL